MFSQKRPKPQVVEEEPDEPPSDFEMAISTCGLGVFNLCLLLACLPGLWSTIFEVITMSFVFPAAECDLDLSYMKKAALNAVTFGGALLTAIPWGILADTLSRKYIVVYGLLAEGTVTLLSVLSQTAEHLIIFKFIGGLIVCGPVAGFVSYITEFHGMKHRIYVLVVVGFINALPLAILPLTARSIIPDQTSYEIGAVKLNSWKILIAITALPSFLSGFLLLFFPESPKFLMSQGRNGDAIQVFRLIYAMNKFKSMKKFPITALYDEAPRKTLRRSLLVSRTSLNVRSRFKSWRETFHEGLQDIWLLCTKNHVTLTLIVCGMQFALNLSSSTLGLWQHQTSLNAKEMRIKGYVDLDTCAVWEYSKNKTELLKEEELLREIEYKNADECEVKIKKEAYTDNIIIAGGLCANFIFSALLVRVTGNNVLLRIYLIIACISQYLKYWAPNYELSIMLAVINTATGVVSGTLVTSAAVNLYPTTIRTLAVILLNSSARLGGVIGNLLFPLLVSIDCLALYVFYSVTYLFTFGLSIFMPNTTMDTLK